MWLGVPLCILLAVLSLCVADDVVVGLEDMRVPLLRLLRLVVAIGGGAVVEGATSLDLVIQGCLLVHSPRGKVKIRWLPLE